MDGIVIINKPLNMSSHDCVNKVRKLFNTKKVGHSGTLDKAATGVLVLGINKGTKLLNYLNQDDKAYEFTVCFGKTTDTRDHEGVITETKPVANLKQLDGLTDRFIGEYNQVPPDYSAVKIAGKKMYQYARQNMVMPILEPRKITVFTLKKLTDFVQNNDCVEASFYVKSTKGLYVRQLAYDLALLCDTVGHTTRIHRVQAGQYNIDQATPLDLLETSSLIPMADVLNDLPKITLEPSQINRVKDGQMLLLDIQDDMIQCLNDLGDLIAIYRRHESGEYHAKNVFI